MASVKKHVLTAAREWWQHLRPFGKRDFWKRERQAHKTAVRRELKDSK